MIHESVWEENGVPPLGMRFCMSASRGSRCGPTVFCVHVVMGAAPHPSATSSATVVCLFAPAPKLHMPSNLTSTSNLNPSKSKSMGIHRAWRAAIPLPSDDMADDMWLLQHSSELLMLAN